MWRKAGVVRNQAQLEQALTELVELRTELAQVGCPGGPLYNLAWSSALNLENALDVSEAIVRCALARQESRGAHYRSDFPERNDEEFLCNFILTHAQRPPNASYRHGTDVSGKFGLAPNQRCSGSRPPLAFTS
jgi:succinate dehydrogenase/fumarate reductase flavoprotein subunit|tara:strand:- start:170 stop:568 length:399 start_codon:yes stop_codon:yes gene_type:complete